ncbi:hypothetical protein [Gluconobacter sphaericus]|uniref:Uncharacterized protein n=1 Tax=Gluconobacter sphaericus NBRC 12467 TaxID=1307951 RepID=A0AA37WC60_9PROT|nr:hypothetical protein [Gluconobacter sphaericus]MBF0885545.1 hypothetical protein [Gluconobacter sphaericus]GBR56512.1 hypothetical protein AA12467_2649 [Gluconobacter sphaericus NBRC 12467]GEB42783.1 hypothetical protein GSP01_15650 [Gluconobacter sphaericus NBRC 12467]GLQ84759.1 hypothetical protein GCM10007872_16670 [Gluconobacter sphaericus NBRC 12467]GLQ85086.1 hypothetical protein GCM10007872_19940 [Gluconobacter sphaericus NBRC 12467]
MADEKKTEKPAGDFKRDPRRMTAEDLKKRGTVIAMDGMPPDLKKALAERDQKK